MLFRSHKYTHAHTQIHTHTHAHSHAGARIIAVRAAVLFSTSLAHLYSIFWSGKIFILQNQVTAKIRSQEWRKQSKIQQQSQKKVQKQTSETESYMGRIYPFVVGEGKGGKWEAAVFVFHTLSHIATYCIASLLNW